VFFLLATAMAGRSANIPSAPFSIFFEDYLFLLSNPVPAYNSMA
jgi:hypothetical protein